MRRHIACVCLMLILFSFIGSVFAHPGHGTTDPQAVTHYIAEPVHLAPVMLIVAVAAVGISLLTAGRRRALRQ